MDGSVNKKRSMAHYVQAEHKKTRQNRECITCFTVPQVGDIIIYNEIQKFHYKHDCTPVRGIAVVQKVIGCNVMMLRMGKQGDFFCTSVRVADFRLGLYRFIKIIHWPEECPKHSDIDIFQLSSSMKELVADEKELVKIEKERKK